MHSVHLPTFPRNHPLSGHPSQFETSWPVWTTVFLKLENLQTLQYSPQSNLLRLEKGIITSYFFLVSISWVLPSNLQIQENRRKRDTSCILPSLVQHYTYHIILQNVSVATASIQCCLMLFAIEGIVAACNLVKINQPRDMVITRIWRHLNVVCHDIHMQPHWRTRAFSHSIGNLLQ